VAALVDSTPVAAINDPLTEARRALLAAIGGAGDTPAEDTELTVATTVEQARRAFDREAWPAVLKFTTVLDPALATTGKLDPATTEIVLMAATAARQIGDHTAVERLVASYGDRLASTSDDAVLRLLAGNARFDGTADDVLGEATSYVRTMRQAVANMPAL
jgi:hypothetical protein